ncbi:hypothetical protein GCM10010191_60710 [Actinomadura vinacea]|uniref:Ferredoxin n=1 Tax=Actinomadura vinacea TaxID=115336 RepID=A0ABP5WZB0_9ACTN
MYERYSDCQSTPGEDHPEVPPFPDRKDFGPILGPCPDQAVNLARRVTPVRG